MPKKAVVLINLGTPAEPTTKSVKQFLKVFLSDPRVIEVPKFIWWFILNLIILPFRSPKVAKAYQSIWYKQGSPLRVITQQQVIKLQELLNGEYGEAAPKVCYAMSYCGPDLQTVVAELKGQGVEQIFLLPLYPQYSATTTACIYDQVSAIYKNSRDIPDIRINKQYCQYPPYIDALAQSIEEYWQQHGKPERLLLSFHGLPQAYVDKGDPYFEQCHATAKAVADKLQLSESQWQVSFQSRLGRSEWLKPYTNSVLEEWGQSALSRVDVVCPAFSVDCLETLEEISEENKELFVAAGGKSFHYISCLNDNPAHIEMMKKLVQQEFNL
jgi:ferrochelatase